MILDFSKCKTAADVEKVWKSHKVIKELKGIKWDEIGDTIFISKKSFYRLLRLIKNIPGLKIEILSHTGSKPKI